MFKKLLDIFNDFFAKPSDSGNEWIEEYKEYVKNGGKKDVHQWKLAKQSEKFHRDWAQYKKDHNLCDHVKSGKKSKNGYDICGKCGKEINKPYDDPNKYDTLMG